MSSLIRPHHARTRVLLALLLATSAMTAFGQGSASITVDRNPLVANQPFRITFEFKDARVNFSAPPSIEGLRFVSGPATSNSTQIVNGSMSSSRSYTYTAVASTVGVMRIPALRFKSGRDILETRPITLRVAAEGDRNSAAPAQFEAVIEADQRSVFLGEPVRIQYRIYNRLDAVDVRSYTFPDLTGAWRETVEGEDPRWENTVINGQRFQVATIRTDILYPTQTGTLQLEGFDVEAQARISFFNTRPLASSARPVSIEVKPLPGNAPSPSLGTFGDLKVRWFSEGTPPLTSNEAINLTLEFSGQGNLGLIGTPDMNWPADLEVFDPEIKDRIRTTVNGQSGKRTLTYLVIPRAEGAYDIALPDLSYFDWKTARYERVSVPPIHLDIEGSAEEGPSFGFNSKSDVTILTRDVRFIRTETELRPRTQPFFGGPLHLGLWAFPPVGLAALAMMRTRRRLEESDPASARKKRTRKALKALLSETDRGKASLDQLGAAVHAYLQALIDLAQSEANRSAYEAALRDRCSESTTRVWLDIVDAVDRGRFAPGAPEPAALADRIREALKQLDTTPRRGAAGGGAALLAMLLWTGLAASAAPDPGGALAEFQRGNVAYTNGEFEEAISAYTAVAEKWTSFELEYNLGGAHYKAGQIGPCILHYERARRLRPNDDDLSANLLLAQAAVTDRIEGMPEIGIASIWRELISQERLAGWTAASLFLWLLGFGLLGFRMFQKDIAQRRWLGLTAPAVLLLALGLGALSKQTHQRIVSEEGAVVMAPRVEVMSAPSGGEAPSKLFVLHEGTVVELLREEGAWRQVRLANGNSGWLEASAVEGI